MGNDDFFQLQQRGVGLSLKERNSTHLFGKQQKTEKRKCFEPLMCCKFNSSFECSDILYHKRKAKIQLH